MSVDSPTLAGFWAFIRGTMGINSVVLPDSSTTVPFAYKVAKVIANMDFAILPPIYSLMVYNLGGSNVINFAPDQNGQTYFADLRKNFNINSFIAGVVSASRDEATSQTLVVQKAAEDFTLADLQLLKDPYGRVYLQFAQKYGGLVGIS